VTLGLSILIALGGCAGSLTDVVARASPGVDFQAFRTYAFVPVDGLDMAGSQMRDPVTRMELETAIGRELRARGLVPAAGDAKPSLMVAYFADVYEGPDKNRPTIERTAETNYQRQGILKIDIMDTATQQVVWHGEAWTRDPNFKVANLIVAELFRKYPQPR
jgi:hypothetical protein